MHMRTNNIASTIVVMAALSASSVICLSPAHAADFEQGCEFYKAKNYSQARASFEKAVKLFPNNWLVHYYLANTYLLSSQSASAAREYQACLNCKPHATTAKYCQDALLKLGVTPVAVNDSSLSTDSPEAPPAGALPAASGSQGKKDPVAAETKSDASETKPAKSDVKEAASQAIIAADNARAEEILKRAREECKAIRAEAKERIANGKETGNQWYRRPDGTRFIDLRQEEKDAINKEAEDRCEDIMHTAETSASRLQH